MTGPGVSQETQLHFKLCQARISDYSRKFLEAATRYHEISWMGIVDEEERRLALCVGFRTSPHICRYHN